MGNHTKVHADTEAFGRVSGATYQAILDVIPLLGAVLNWEPLACAFLADVLRHIPLNGEPFVMSHVEFARLLWGVDIAKEAARRRIGRCVKALMGCQAMSGFLAVWIEVGKRVERKDGEVEFFHTTYRCRDFLAVFREIRLLAVEQDLMALPMRQRKATELAIIQSVCDAHEYQKIPARARQQRHFQSENAKPEPAPKAEAVPPPGIVSFSEYQAAYHERLFQELVATGIGDAGRALMSEALKATRLTERRWLDAVRSNGRGASK